MLESDWLVKVIRCAIIFREKHGKHCSRQVLTTLHVHMILPTDLLYFKGPYSQNSKRIKTHNDTGQTNKYSRQKYKNDRSYPYFATKLGFIMYGMQILSLSRSLSLTDAQFEHILTLALMLLAQLWRFYQ